MFQASASLRFSVKTLSTKYVRFISTRSITKWWVSISTSECELKFHCRLRQIQTIFVFRWVGYSLPSRINFPYNWEVLSYSLFVLGTYVHICRRCWRANPETSEHESELFNCSCISFSRWSANDRIKQENLPIFPLVQEIHHFHHTFWFHQITSNYKLGFF